jgi:CRP-like cAMP-binding protein
MSASTDAHLPTILTHAGPHLKMPAGWPLATQGDRGTTAYVVMSGTLLVSRDGSEIGRIGPGEMAGEQALLSGRPRNATLTAATPVEVIALDRASFEAHRKASPALRAHLERAGEVR